MLRAVTWDRIGRASARATAGGGCLNECAGPGHFMRVGRDVVAGWKIPGFMKAQLVEVGIPVAPRLVEQVRDAERG